MHEHLSTKSDDFFTATVDWPYEMVHAVAKVQPLRQSNPLERVILQILREFRKNPPSLKEAANELGIMEPVFFEVTLGKMVEKGILEKINSAGPFDFTNCRIQPNSSGENNKSPIIENPGVRFCFDAVTSAHIPHPPASLKDHPENPVIEPNQLAAKRTHLGLDKARQWAINQQEPFMSESCRMIEITVSPEQGKYVWQPLPITCYRTNDGSLHCRSEQATEQQQQWLDRLGANDPLFQKLKIQNSAKNPVKNEIETSINPNLKGNSV